MPKTKKIKKIVRVGKNMPNNMTIYGKKNQYVEDRPMGFCESCNRRYKQRLNIVRYNNGITAYICDKCTDRFHKGKII